MFTGHFAVALAGAGRSPRIPLGLLIGAAFIGDLTEAVVAAFNRPDPTRAWSHSLPATAIAGAVLAMGWRLFGGKWGEAGIVLIVAMSHTALDFLTAIKTFWPGLPPFGLQLYSRPAIEYVLEVVAVLAGWSAWRRALPKSRRRTEPVWAMLVMLLVVQTAVSAGGIIFGPDPDNDAMSKFVR